MRGLRNPVPHPSRRPAPVVSPADLIADWLATLQRHELGHEARQLAEQWSAWFRDGGPPPEPLPLEPTPIQVEQAFRSFMRNAYRTARLEADGRMHDLRNTVSDLVDALTSQSHLIANTRKEVHALLHRIEDAIPDSPEVTDVASAIRKRLRELDNEAQNVRAGLNERLQGMRSDMLSRLGTPGELVDNEARREMYFRTLCSAAGLFGERVNVISISVDRPAGHADRLASHMRAVFRRDTDIVCRIGAEVSVIVIDTPDKHVVRLTEAAAAQLDDDLRKGCTVAMAFGAQSVQSVQDALTKATRVSLCELVESAATGA